MFHMHYALVIALLTGLQLVSCTGGEKANPSEKSNETKPGPTPDPGTAKEPAKSVAPYQYPVPAGDPERKVGSSRIFISGGRVLTATGKVLAPGFVIIEQGQIKALGEGPGPTAEFQGETDRIIEAAGFTITPGLIDSHSHMGVYPNPSADAHSDGNEATRNSSPEVHAEDSFWPQDPSLWRALAGGVTTIQVLPGSANLIGGKSFIAKLKPGVAARTMRFPGAPVGLKMACGENPKRVYKNKGGPSTRMGNVAGYKAQLQKAHEKLYAMEKYEIKLAEWQKKIADAGTDKEKIEKAGEPPMAPSLEHGVQVLVDLLQGKIAAHIHCYRADEMAIMMDLAEEYGFTIKSFHHGLEAYKIKDRLAAKAITVSTWADWWGFKMEAYDGIPHNIVLLEKAGGLPLVHSDSEKDVRILAKEAAKAAASGYRLGLTPDENTMLRWVTVNPAKALSIDHLVGTIEEGKQGDIVIWDGSPFSVYAKAQVVIIDGEIVFDRKEELFPLSDFELGSNNFGLGDGSKVQSEPYPVPAAAAELITGTIQQTDQSPKLVRGDFVIQNARIELGNGEIIPKGSVVVTNGKITAVSQDVLGAPGANAEVINAEGKTLTPGFIETWTQLGLYEVGSEPSTVDSEMQSAPISPALNAADAFHPHSIRIPLQRTQGVTSVVASPSGGLIAGQGFAYDLTDHPAPLPGVAMFAAIGSLSKGHFGDSRAGMWLRLREILDDAQFYLANKSAINIGQSRPLSLDRLNLEALGPVLSGQQPLVVIAFKESDIRALINWQKSMAKGGQNLKLILAGANEGWVVARELAEAKIPVIINPTDQVPFSFDATKSRDDNGAILAKAGVTVILSSHSWMNNARRLRQEAGIAVSYGFPRAAAVAAMTSIPAQVFGLKDLGEIKAGNRAHLVLWSGDPLEMLTLTERVFIDGEEQDLTSRPDLLAKRYL